MSNPDLRRYEKELRASVKGFRLRRRLHRSFRQAVIPFLEETAAPAMRNSPPPSAPQTRWPRICRERWPTLPSPLRRGQKGGNRLGRLFAGRYHWVWGLFLVEYAGN